MLQKLIYTARFMARQHAAQLSERAAQQQATVRPLTKEELLTSLHLAADSTADHIYRRVLQLGADNCAALRSAATIFRLQRNDAMAAGCLGTALHLEGDHAQAVVLLEECIGLGAGEAKIHASLAGSLLALNKTEEAAAVCKAAEHLHDPWFLLHDRLLMLPRVFYSEEHLLQSLQHFQEGLSRLEQQTAALSPDIAQRLLTSMSPIFHLPYLGHNVCQDLARYGKVIQQLVTAAHPAWKFAARTLRHPVQRLRIGYVSCHFYIHSAGLLSYGWMTAHDRERFEVFVYQIGKRHDILTARVAQQCEHFRQCEAELRGIRETILGDALDILVYVDIGMETLTLQLASLSLAPVQCASWAHPVTTGLPTIDYFISNECMETLESDTHYCEKLIRLPGIGANVEPPWLPPPTNVRECFGIASDAIVYVSLQPVAKYLPEYDGLYVAIAQAVPNACFLLSDRDGTVLTRIVVERLQKHFIKASLDPDRYLLVVPMLSYEDYLGLLLTADALLDPPGCWSAGMTAFEAVACNLPIVTLPHSFLRTRRAYGILQQLGVTTTIATDACNYISIAARLGKDVVFNTETRQGMNAGKAKLFYDVNCVRALEAFYRSVC